MAQSSKLEDEYQVAMELSCLTLSNSWSKGSRGDLKPKTSLQNCKVKLVRARLTAKKAKTRATFLGSILRFTLHAHPKPLTY
jgi:hypothetical protein